MIKRLTCAFLELAQSDSEEVSSGERSGPGGNIKNKKGGKGDIEWKNGFNAVGSVISTSGSVAAAKAEYFFYLMQ
jgi:hypothetical protein